MKISKIAKSYKQIFSVKGIQKSCSEQGSQQQFFIRIQLKLWGESDFIFFWVFHAHVWRSSEKSVY